MALNKTSSEGEKRVELVGIHIMLRRIAGEENGEIRKGVGGSGYSQITRVRLGRSERRSRIYAYVYECFLKLSQFEARGTLRTDPYSPDGPIALFKTYEGTRDVLLRWCSEYVDSKHAQYRR